MYKFLAKRIHDGYLTWEEVEKKSFADKVKKAYEELYGVEE